MSKKGQTSHTHLGVCTVEKVSRERVKQSRTHGENPAMHYVGGKQCVIKERFFFKEEFIQLRMEKCCHILYNTALGHKWNKAKSLMSGALLDF